MVTRYHFSYETHWQTAPVAFWVHLPVDGSTTLFNPPAPSAVPHKGFVFLHVEFEGTDLQFSAPRQLDHFIEVLSTKPLPTSRRLSSSHGLPAGPNSHWLSRLPASIKSPGKRMQLVEAMRAVREKVLVSGDGTSFTDGEVKPAVLERRTQWFER